MTVFSLNKVFFFSLNKQNERKKKTTGFKWTFMYGSTDMPQEVTLGTEQKTEYGSVLIPKHHSFRSLINSFLAGKKMTNLTVSHDLFYISAGIYRNVDYYISFESV